jgi:hypothetical protein
VGWRGGLPGSVFPGLLVEDESFVYFIGNLWGWDRTRGGEGWRWWWSRWATLEQFVSMEPNLVTYNRCK